MSMVSVETIYPSVRPSVRALSWAEDVEAVEAQSVLRRQLRLSDGD